MHQHRFGTKRRMPGDERLAVAAIHQRVRAVLRLDAQDRTLRQPVEEHAAFDFRCDEVVVHGVTQVWVRTEQIRQRHADFGFHIEVRSYFKANSAGFRNALGPGCAAVHFA